MEWFIKANLNLALLYFCYQLLMQFSTNRNLSRTLLLLIPVLSCGLPLLSFPMATGYALAQVELPEMMVNAAAIASSNKIEMMKWVQLIYLTGAIGSVLMWMYALVVHLRKPANTAYSILFYMHVPQANLQQAEMMRLHEEAHVKYRHSLDVFYFLIVKAVFWFNPVVYFLFTGLKQEHEYAADQYALERCGDTKAYCDLLVDETFGVVSAQSPVHSFHSKNLLLNRIKMITQTQPQSVPVWKKIAVLPILAVFFIVLFTGYRTTAQQLTTDKVYTEAEVMPEYPGGAAEMMIFLNNELQYPAECREKKIEGRVIVQFVVDENGRIINIENMKKEVDERLVNEAIRVVKKMPQWKPGVKDGKAVKVKFTLPMVFKL